MEEGSGGGGGGAGGSCGCSAGGGGGSGPPGGGSSPGGGAGGPPGGGSPISINLPPMPPIVATPFGGGSDALARAALIGRVARSRHPGAAVFLRRLQLTERELRGQPRQRNPFGPVFTACGRSRIRRAPIVIQQFRRVDGDGSRQRLVAFLLAPNHRRRRAPPVVITGSGQAYTYGGSRTGGVFLPPGTGSSAVNSLFAQTGFSGYTETQPDGTAFTYSAAPLAHLLTVSNPAGAIWTVSRDGSGRVSSVVDPIGRPTTLAYNATSGKITSIQDSYGRLTSITVNSSGNLVQVTTPELCVFSFVYDGSNRLISTVNPLGDRTSYAFDGSNRVTAVTSPLGQVVTLAYSTNRTVVTNPLGFVTTLNFTANGSIASATDGAGNLTSYSWDSLNNLTAIIDGLGHITTFGYATNATTKVENLSSITQPQGGIFTYTYNSNGQVSGVTDQLGNTTSLVWNSAGLRTAAIERWGTGHRIRITALVNWPRSRTRWASS